MPVQPSASCGRAPRELEDLEDILSDIEADSHRAGCNDFEHSRNDNQDDCIEAR